MSYQLPVTLSLALFLSACTNITQTPKVQTPKAQTVQVKKVKEKKVIKTTSIAKDTQVVKPNIQLSYQIEDNKNIQGNYVLERGQISFGDIRKNISNSNLVIEKLDDKNFGYYYTVQVEAHVPDEYFGIFYYKDGKFVQKVIADGGDVSYYDNIELIKEGNRLKLTVKTNKGKRIIIWDKVEEMIPNQNLLKAEKSYKDICKAKYNDLTFN